MLRRWILAALLFVSAPNLRAETITVEKDGALAIDCVCVLATSGCHNTLVDAASGAQRLEWKQDILTQAGMKLDLNEVCWRKRDADPRRVCCVTQDKEDTIKKLFLGRLPR